MKIFILLFGVTLMIFMACSGTDNIQSESVKNKTDEEIEFYLGKVEQDPTSYSYYNRLAQAYFQKARETGDAEYYKKAESALGQSLKANPKNYVGTVYMAMINIAEHNFRDALEYAKRATELESGKSYAYGVLGDAYLDLGEIGHAENAYNRMLELNPSLDSWSRVSNLRVVKGDTNGAIDAMEKAYDTGLKDARTSRENLAWTQVLLGSIYLNHGELNRAEKYYLRGLDIMPDYYLALEHLAEVSAIRGDYDRAEALYIKVLELNPAPEFYLALAAVYEDRDEPDKADELSTVALRIYERKVDSGDQGYLRALALLYAENDKNLPRALELAKKDLEIRNDHGAYDTLGWVYFKMGDYEKALMAASESLRHGTKNSNLYYHLGMINYKLKNYGDASKYLALALENNPYFDIAGASESRAVLEKLNNSQS